MSKILTERLITEKMEDLNILIAEELSDEDKLRITKKHFDFSISNDWGNPDIMFYTETTTDGYELWVATEDSRNTSISEDVYYYDSEWLEKMPDAMTEGRSIYYEDFNQWSYEFSDILDEVYEKYWNDKKQEIEDELIEQGYEYEDKTETA